MFWAKLTTEEQKQYRKIRNKVDQWISYCEGCRKAKPRIPIDYTLDVSTEEYLLLDQLSAKGWGQKY